MNDSNPKLLSTRHISKLLIVAILLAMLTSITTFWIYNSPQNDIFPFNQLENNKEEEFQLIKWDFRSGLTLSSQLNQEINKLMHFEITAGYRIENPTGGYHYDSIEGINYNVVEIEAWLYDGSWRMWIVSNTSNCPGDIFCAGDRLYELNETDNMNNLYSSFTQDIANIGSFINVTNNGTEEISFLNSEIEILIWEITHVYKDGTFMRFNLFNNTMIIRYTPLETFLIYEDGVAYGPSINNINSISFKAKIRGSILPNYIDGINSLLSIIVNL